MTAVAEPRLDAEAYLAWEAAQPLKHEFVAGEVFAMAGASDAHVTVAESVVSPVRACFRLETSPIIVVSNGSPSGSAVT